MADPARLRPANHASHEFPRGRMYTRQALLAETEFRAEAILGPTMERRHKSSGRNESFPPLPCFREEKSREMEKKASPLVVSACARASTGVSRVGAETRCGVPATRGE